MPHICSCCDIVEVETMVMELKPERENLVDKPDAEAKCTTSGNRKKSMNHYATKKSAAQSMLDVALLIANSSQLKIVLYVGPQYRYYHTLIVLLSITLQVIVGLLLLFIVTYDLKDDDEDDDNRKNIMNNAATVFVFFTVLINIFITALGFEGHVLRSFGTPGVSIKEPKLSILPGDINTTGLTLPGPK